MSTLANELLGDGFQVIDVDTHFSEPWDLWTSRAPAKYQDLVPQVKEVDGQLRWVLNDSIVMGNTGASCIIDKDGNKTKFWDTDITNGRHVEEVHGGARRVEPRLELMDDQGVWAQIVYPNVAGFGAGKLLRLEDRDLALAIVQTYNDAMAEWASTSHGRLHPQALIPFWDIDQAVAEITRCRTELGMRGITMSGEPFKGGLPDLQERHWDPFYEVVTELAMPINIHIGAGEQDGGPATYGARVWPSHDVYRRNVLKNVQLELGNSNFVTNLVTSDVLIRWPETKWVSVESGIGWIPYALERTDYQLQESLPDDPAMQRPSSRELFRQSVYACFWFEQSGPRHLIEDIGADNVLFETDFPHPTCLYPDPVEYALNNMRELPVDVIRKVMGDNARKLYHLDEV